jgi:hypothetical protein
MRNTEAPQEAAGHSGNGDDQSKRQDQVTITIDNADVPIHRGRQSVAAIKSAGKVPLAYQLEQVNDGGTPPLTELKDDGSVTIKGGERFLSHPRDSGSSSCGPRAADA